MGLKPKKRPPAANSLSNSERQAFANCRKKWYWQYHEKLTPLTVPTPFLVGSAVHKGLAAFYEGEEVDAAAVVDEVFRPTLSGEDNRFLDADQLEDLQKQAVMSEGMIEAYCTERAGDLEEFEVLEVERQGSFPINDRWDMYFTLDALVRWKKKVWVMEHKTAASVDAGYVGRLSLDQQVSTYMRGAELCLGYKPAGVIYNILMKPRIRQKKKETKEEYLQRVRDLYSDSPGEYLHREVVRRSKNELEAFDWELGRFVKDMERAEQTKFWYMNTNACVGRGTCPYMPLCVEGEQARDRFREREARSQYDEED